MIFYKINYRLLNDDHDKTRSLIAKSLEEAASYRKQLRQKSNFKPNSINTYRVDIPTGKNDLVQVFNWMMSDHEQIESNFHTKEPD